MSSIETLILVLLPVALLVFWFWMFKDMTDSEDAPPCFLTITHGTNRKLDWALTFVLLNVITASIYYVSVYRNKG